MNIGSIKYVAGRNAERSVKIKLIKDIPTQKEYILIQRNDNSKATAFICENSLKKFIATENIDEKLKLEIYSMIEKLTCVCDKKNAIKIKKKIRKSNNSNSENNEIMKNIFSLFKMHIKGSRSN